MSVLIGITVGVAAIGFGAGLYAWPAATVATNFDAGIAVVIGSSLLLGLWGWWKARPGSGDVMVLPTLVLLQTAMLIGILPRVFWPSARSLHLTGSISSALIMAVVLIAQDRKRRRPRPQV